MRTSALTVFTRISLALAAAVPALARAQELTLVINPRTGHTSIQNVGSSAVNLNGYLLASPDGAFNLNGWTSLENSGGAGWREANPAENHIAETNLLSTSSIAAGGTVSLGAAYSPFLPTTIGQVEPPVAFDYHVAGGGTFSGDVLFAPANNLVLIVDRETGAASIQNQSNFNVSVNGYLITSPTGVLAPQTWTSFIDSGAAGWSEANPAAKHLGETNLLGSRLFAANGSPVSIGSPINAALLTDQSDLTFEYHVAGGETVRGSVAFALPAVEPAGGDFDDDGDVDGGDFLAWQRGLGAGFDAGDLAAWRNSFGAGGAAVTASGDARAVPEPDAVALACLACFGTAWIKRRRSPTA